MSDRIHLEDHSASAHHAPNRLRQGILGATLVAALGIGTIIAWPSLTAAVTAAVTPANEPYTELYFTSSRNLPKTYIPGTSHTIRISVHNVQGRDMTYRYQRYVNGAPAGAVKQLFVPDGVTTAVNETIPLATSDARVEVTIKLLTTGQEIHYWTEKEATK